MSDVWIDFKRAFGAYATRSREAGAAVDDMSAQESAMRGLARQNEANALHVKQQAAALALGTARGKGDSTAGYRELGDVMDQARAGMSVPIETEIATKTLAALEALSKRIRDALDQSDKKPGKSLLGRADALDATIATMKKATNLNAAQVTKAEDGARKLLDDVLAIAYSADRFRKEMVPDEKAKAYAAMLKARYGITTDSPMQPGIDKFYDALSLVPPFHAAHDSLTHVQISSAGGALGDYATSGKRIRIDTAQVKKKPTMQYVLNGSSSKLNTFNVTVLHEVGHSVDDKAGIMAHPGGADFGGWEIDLKIGYVADAYWESIKAKIGNDKKDVMVAAITEALGGKDPVRPAEVGDDLWRLAEPTLKICKEIAADKEPWVKARPVADRCFFQDKGVWRSYSLAARNALTVREYQWRSPAEWFAEIYAASWMMKKKPSGNVNQAAMTYMYVGS
jgi:hypothetical protein